jgi:plasmid maintenance system killer protein
VIRTLAGDTTRDIWNGVNSKAARRIPRELWPNVRCKLDQIDAVRVNDQYRIVFRFEGGDAFDVRCTDYQ